MRSFVTAVLFGLLLVGCAAPAPSPTAASLPSTAASVVPTASSRSATAFPPTAGPTADARTEGWQEDLHMLVPGMDALHPELDHGISIDELNRQAEALGNTAPTATNDEMMVGVLRIVASVSADGCDGHLGAYIWGTGSYPVQSLPLRLWLFDDVYIVDALPPYEHLIGTRIDRISDYSIEQVMELLDPIIPRDNDQTVRLLMPRFLLIPQVLRGLGILGGAGQSVELQLESGQGSVFQQFIDPISMGEYNIWAGPYGLHLPEDPDVLYLSRISEDLWWENLDENTLYVQYNRVERRILATLGDALTDESVATVVLDLRHNFGGEASVADQFTSLISDWAADHPDHLYVVTGRNTFSAGSTITTRLHDQASAVIVGEPMGGCPTFWADIEPFGLPYSGLEVSVPTLLEVSVDANDDRQTLDPDLPAPLAVADWAGGVDPALEAILAADR